MLWQRWSYEICRFDGKIEHFPNDCDKICLNVAAFFCFVILLHSLVVKLLRVILLALSSKYGEYEFDGNSVNSKNRWPPRESDPRSLDLIVRCSSDWVTRLSDPSFVSLVLAAQHSLSHSHSHCRNYYHNHPRVAPVWPRGSVGRENQCNWII